MFWPFSFLQRSCDPVLEFPVNFSTLNQISVDSMLLIMLACSNLMGSGVIFTKREINPFIMFITEALSNCFYCHEWMISKCVMVLMVELTW